ncbi:MAG: hypothetical protein Ct9H300mP11_31680 [Chloroflexota bacterium]|nr:MAG: hypothetical protein Ct9H300mP11_31680 [Chloroflexota bacterium]
MAADLSGIVIAPPTPWARISGFYQKAQAFADFSRVYLTRIGGLRRHIRTLDSSSRPRKRRTRGA